MPRLPPAGGFPTNIKRSDQPCPNSRASYRDLRQSGIPSRHERSIHQVAWRSFFATGPGSTPTKSARPVGRQFAHRELSWIVNGHRSQQGTPWAVLAQVRPSLSMSMRTTAWLRDRLRISARASMEPPLTGAVYGSRIASGDRVQCLHPDSDFSRTMTHSRVPLLPVDEAARRVEAHGMNAQFANLSVIRVLLHNQRVAKELANTVTTLLFTGTRSTRDACGATLEVGSRPATPGSPRHRQQSQAVVLKTVFSSDPHSYAHLAISSGARACSLHATQCTVASSSGQKGDANPSINLHTRSSLRFVALPMKAWASSSGLPGTSPPSA